LSFTDGAIRFIAWGGRYLFRGRLGRRARAWLRANTVDEPGRSHATTDRLAVALRVAPEDVRHACRQQRDLHQSSQDPDLWSVWRAEPQSVYETRGIRTL
jgi:hypothetical protein